jgi:hypothetical protein
MTMVYRDEPKVVRELWRLSDNGLEALKWMTGSFSATAVCIAVALLLGKCEGDRLRGHQDFVMACIEDGGSVVRGDCIRGSVD